MADTLTKWAMRSPPGSRRCYYSGFLMADRQRRGARGNVPTPQALEVDALGLEAWTLYKSGFVTLMQQRHGPGAYDYIAMCVGHTWRRDA